MEMLPAVMMWLIPVAIILSDPGQEFLIKRVAERTGAPDMLVRWLADRAEGCRDQAEPPA